MSEFIQQEELAEHIILLRLNRPESYNALNFELMRQFEARLKSLEDEDIRAIILTGTAKSFSSGADLKEIQQFDQNTAREFSLAGHRLFSAIEQFPAPVLAAVNGYALGGGCELACACDIRYAAESAKFGQPESRVGMIPGWGGTFRLARYVGVARAKEMIYTGRMVPADEAQATGLVNGVFDDDALLESVLDIAKKIATNAPIATRLSKKMLNRHPWDLQTLVNEEALALAHCVNTEDQTEAIQAFLEKREPKFQNK